MIGLNAFGSQQSPNRQMAHICSCGYSPCARLRLLLEFTQHMLFKFQCPRTPSTPGVVHLTDKRTGFSETPMQVFGSFSVRQAPRRKSLPLQSPGPPGHSYPLSVNEMDIGHFLISVASHSFSHEKRKHDECRHSELL
ncbi:hypothetical protein TNIN_299571 [Trichonephila inaurata madagascariensis]|uniref:Uncharacterized protein n=1 Tax=Trichonephila inaurata madagascariensis TaxID=2747483 RepID=A0A8X7BXZ1_9ARAC|nr:hypothetical protein TNIN_299571 [Trichonephila inaurata madagascariensis]